MTLWCVIPVKPFEDAKTRLAPELCAAARQQLAAGLFRRTLRVVRDFAGASPVLVVTRATDIIDLTVAGGALSIHEGPRADMNAALVTAAAHAIARGASAILAISADLPLLDRAGLVEMTSHPAASLAPDRHGTGTNAVFWPGNEIAPYRFGPDSFRHHVAAMAARGVRPRVVRRYGLGLDIDEFADISCLEAKEGRKEVFLF
jgi:2-phospho-L-lactate guanylyltransferase